MHTSGKSAEKIVIACIREICSIPKATFLYGSSAIDLLNGRDIDVLSIVPESEHNGHPRLTSFEVCELGGRTLNHYEITTVDFEHDVFVAKYGGFYAEKFSLNSRAIDQSNNYRADLVYWSTAIRRSEQISNDINYLIRTVHLDICAQKPLFMAPLSKFIKNRARTHALFAFVNDNIQLLLDTISPAHKIPSEEIIPPKEMNQRFWDEYTRHKDGTKDSLTTRTNQKIATLKGEIDLAAISSYFQGTISKHELLSYR